MLPGVKAPHRTRPLRAPAWTPGPRGTAIAFIAGRPRSPFDATRSHVAIRNWMVFSLDVLTTREDGWDRDAIVRGFWGWRDFGCSRWTRQKTVG